MNKAVALLAVLVLLCGLVLPSDAWAGGSRGGWHGGGGWHHGGGWHRGGGCCWGWFWPGAVVGGLVAGAVVATTAPFAYAAPPVAYPAPAYAQAPPMYTTASVYAAAPPV